MFPHDSPDLHLVRPFRRAAVFPYANVHRDRSVSFVLAPPETVARRRRRPVLDPETSHTSSQHRPEKINRSIMCCRVVPSWGTKQLRPIPGRPSFETQVSDALVFGG